jgi:acetyltransferase-like isoleucine patch superfamily enzyme
LKYRDEISLEERKRKLNQKVREGEFFVFDRGYVAKNANFGVNVGQSRLGEGTTVGEECLFRGIVRIGSNCMFGYRCMLLAENHVFWNPPEKPFCTQGATDEPIDIGNDVWIGACVIITGNVVIGSHAVIGAGSVVTHSIPEWEIWAGNPAHKIGDRRTWKKF